jgi:hypothetical protein
MGSSSTGALVAAGSLQPYTITPTLILLFVIISSYFVVPIPFDVVGLTF